MTREGCFNGRKWGVAIALTLLGASFFGGEKTKAQIVPDATLPNNSTVAPFRIINFINGGTRAGNNLFHSFNRFSLPSGNIAYFNNALDIVNIFSRITGGNLSNIDGTLLANGRANLFILNPNGIILGPNAKLAIGGSFISTTANAIGFGNRGTFNATVPNNPSLLTIEPSFFQYDPSGSRGAGRAVTQPTNSIEVKGTLMVNPGNSILLVGGNSAPNATSTGSVLIDGSVQAFLIALGGRIEVGGVLAPGIVGLERDANNPRLMSLNFPQGVRKSDVSIINRAALEVRGNNGGAIAISAGQLNVKDSLILTGITVGGGFPGAKAGDLTINATDATLDGSVAIAQISSRGTGDGGNINIATRTLSVKNGTQIGAGVFGRGNAGNVTVTASERIDLDGLGSNGIPSVIASAVGSPGQGNAGNVEITTGTLNITNGGQIQAATAGRGNAGNATIIARNSINLEGEGSLGPSIIASAVVPGAVGNGGNLSIITPTLTATNGGQIQATTGGRGNAGSASIVANSIYFEGQGRLGASGIGGSVQAGAVGNGGNLEIHTGTLTLKNGAQVQAASGGRGNAGNVTIFAGERVNLDGQGDRGASAIGSSVEAGGVGNGGNVTITTGALDVTNGAQIGAAIWGRGNAGNVTVRASSRINVDGPGRQSVSQIASSVQAGGVGNGGNVEIETEVLNLTNGGTIAALTLGRGDAGNIRIFASNRVNADGEGGDGVSSIQSFVAPGAVGNGGNIEIETDALSVTNGALLSAATLGSGNAGNIRIFAGERVNVDGKGSGRGSAIDSSVIDRGVGDGGNIEISTGTLQLTSGGQINAVTRGRGNAGNIAIAARDRITLEGYSELGPSGIGSSVQESGVGNGGNIEISTGTLEVANRSQIAATTLGRGNGGNITITARERVYLDGGNKGVSYIDSSVGESGVGNSGNIEISTGTLDITNGAQIGAATFGQGNGGNITISARDRIAIDGYGLAGSAIGTSAEEGAVGNGGDITLAASSIEITDRGFITASSRGTGDAGDIVQIATRNLYLDNGLINTQSRSGNGGNIRNIQVQDLLLMRNGSQISTTAGTQLRGGGNGGNININAGFVVAVPRENSDITANAFAGNGGNINISTQGIFGFSVQRFLTPRSDITASSQLGINGTINILTLGIDPNRGLVPPPLTPGAPNLPQSCQANAGRGGSRFIESDRGGLLPNPQEALGSSSLWSDARSSELDAHVISNPESEKNGKISEARGWVRGTDSTVVLVGNAPTSSLMASAGC